MGNKRNITICVSWPYANNNLHLGYVASSLSGDILARYHRMVGDDVVMVSGTDSHGTKPTIKAKKEGVTPKDIVDRYHANFLEALDAFDFSFDKFSITYDEYHKEKCMEIFKKLYKNGYLYEKVLNRPYCPTCAKFVADTEIEITCPACGKKTKADNCDCGHVPTEADLEGATCLVCGGATTQKEDKVLVFKLTAFKDVLTKLVNDNEGVWRTNAINETKKYLNDLRDRDFSRDLEWGVKIPVEYGGSGGDYLSYVIMDEELARQDLALAIYANTSNSLGGGPLMLAGSEEQKKLQTRIFGYSPGNTRSTCLS